jgi:hypothetical protein
MVLATSQWWPVSVALCAVVIFGLLMALGDK